ncbi:MAG: hypothetical protein CMO44_05260 [Verrucomicrobiales bacterium]|nr:hypothetical protein [Verrucomicrobiales bacterium]|tara:strand:+ start:1873 stop:2493 length:621 start_codon:yes stop_codon:yes gene_type:complete
MSYNGFDVYKIYLGVKLHFTTDTYDYYKYSGKVNATLDSFTKRKDRYFFYKLSTKYSPSEALDFFVSNFVDDSKKWIGNLINDDGHKVYLQYKKYFQSFDYSLRNSIGNIVYDFSRKRISLDDGLLVVNGQHPRLLRLLIQRKINFPTAIILDSVLDFIKVWDKEITEKVVWPDLSRKLKKMRPFISYNKTQAKLIMKEVITDELK